MEFKDYYQILGVSPDADDKIIKKTYKELVKKYHPDKNPGDKEAEAKFKEINEAYHAIAEPENRKKYDDLRSNYQQWQKQDGRGNFDWSAWQADPQSGGYTHTMSPEEFADLFDGLGLGDLGGFAGDDTLDYGFSEFFSMLFGGMGNTGESGARGARGGRQSVMRRDGTDLQGEVTVSLEDVYRGATRRFEVNGRFLDAKIPPGLRDGSRIRLSGQGGQGQSGGRNGDLLLKINIAPHPVFTRQGDDLSETLEVDFYTAVLGGEIEVPTLEGSVMLKIPPQTQNGRKFRLKDKGMPILKQKGKKGDLYVIIALTLPKNMTEEEIATLRELAQKRAT